MKNIKSLVLFACILSLQPSFACGCGDEYNGGWISNSIFLGSIGLIFFVLLIYFCAKFKAYQLSVLGILVPYIMSMLMILGVYLLADSHRNYVLLPLIHKAISIEKIAIAGFVFVLILWIAPAIYTYRKGRWFKHLSQLDRK